MGLFDPIDFFIEQSADITIPELPPFELGGDVGDFALLGATSEFTTNLMSDVRSTIERATRGLEGYQTAVDKALLGFIGDLIALAEIREQEAIQKIANDIQAVTSTIFNLDGSLRRQIETGTETTIDSFIALIDGIDRTIQGGIEQQAEESGNVITSIFGKITGAIDDTIEGIDSIISPTINKIESTIIGRLNTLEGLVAKPLAALEQSLPLQLAGIGTVIAEGLSGIVDLPEALGGQVRDLFSGLASALGLDQLLSLFTLTGRVIGKINEGIEGIDDLEVQQSSWDVPLSIEDSINVVLSAIPMLGTVAQLKHPGEYERLRLNSFQHTRPTPLDFGSTLEFIRRFPDELNNLVGNLERSGLSDDKIQQLLRINNTPLPVIDYLDAWHRGAIDEDSLDIRLRSNGLSELDIPVAKALSRRLAPIADLILFSVRGVFDVEESRAFGEFEGLPAELEASFIENLGIEGGDFTTQVRVFAEQAAKLGMPPEIVAAYWTSHWRLPSLQTAYEMFHRLQPDIVEAERAEFEADGFDPDSLKFDATQLNRLVRSADYSEFWRDKLSAIAFNPLTRVDIRRMHKLGILDDSATLRAYRKVGFSPSDAAKMLTFTIAFNTEPDKEQTDEVRSLTKAQVLEFVENMLFTPEEGVEALIGIGYSEFAAQGFVDLEIAKRDRNEQKQQIALVKERVIAGLTDLNAASLELDEIGIGPTQKAVLLRDLEIATASKTRLPTKAELADFANGGLITATEYENGLAALGIPDVWIPRYVALNLESP